MVKSIEVCDLPVRCAKFIPQKVDTHTHIHTHTHTHTYTHTHTHTHTHTYIELDCVRRG
jgi:hypothetical protein